MTNQTLPRFLDGQQARRDGKPITANPHPERWEYGDNYPGRWANWRDGWMQIDWRMRGKESDINSDTCAR